MLSYTHLYRIASNLYGIGANWGYEREEVDT